MGCAINTAKDEVLAKRHAMKMFGRITPETWLDRFASDLKWICTGSSW
jgi:hypothetical protein